MHTLSLPLALDKRTPVVVRSSHTRITAHFDRLDIMILSVERMTNRLIAVRSVDRIYPITAATSRQPSTKFNESATQLTAEKE